MVLLYKNTFWVVLLMAPVLTQGSSVSSKDNADKSTKKIETEDYDKPCQDRYDRNAENENCKIKFFDGTTEECKNEKHFCFALEEGTRPENAARCFWYKGKCERMPPVKKWIGPTICIVLSVSTGFVGHWWIHRYSTVDRVSNFKQRQGGASLEILIIGVALVAMSSALYTLFFAKITIKKFTKYMRDHEKEIYADKAGGAIPDVILDYLRDIRPETETALSGVTDGIASYFMLSPIMFGILLDQMDLFSMFAFTYAPMIVLNTFVETATIIPSSMGYARCRSSDLLWGKDVDEIIANVPAGELNGSQASMLWSGHTINAMFGAWFTASMFEREYYSYKLRQNLPKDANPMPILAEGFWASFWKHIFMWTVGIIQGALLLLASDHYTSDVLISLILGTLMVNNLPWQNFVNYFHVSVRKEQKIKFGEGNKTNKYFLSYWDKQDWMNLGIYNTMEHYKEKPSAIYEHMRKVKQVLLIGYHGNHFVDLRTEKRSSKHRAKYQELMLAQAELEQSSYKRGHAHHYNSPPFADSDVEHHEVAQKHNKMHQEKIKKMEDQIEELQNLEDEDEEPVVAESKI